MLLPRVMTAVAGIPLLLWIIHRGGLPFTVFTVGVAALALHEYGLILALGRRPLQAWTALAAGSAVALAVAWEAPLAPIFAAVMVGAVLREMFSAEHSLDRLGLTMFGILFLGLPLAHLALIRDLRPIGEAATFLLFVTVWAMDSAAYAVGKTVGRTPLAARLSPKKTWEGAAAGLAAALAVVLAMRAGFLKEALTLPQAVTLALIIGVLGQLSDLAESLVKRAVGVKDSGALLPGHGGVMDRFDSFILCAPAVYYFLLWVQAGGGA